MKEKVILSKSAPTETIENAFHCALSKYQDFVRGLPAPMSLVNYRLYFLRLIADELDDPSLRKDDGVVDAVLADSGIREVGEQFERVGSNGITERWTVIWRQIGPMWGVEMGLRNEVGKILAGEFSD